MKLVIPLKEYSKYAKKDIVREKVFGDGNFSVIVSGHTGVGKDALLLSLNDTDLENKRTIIIFDTKMEYPNCIFMQKDKILRDMLIEKGIMPDSYKVNLYLPYIVGMEKNKVFRKLFKLKHPKLKLKPFRILTQTLESDDTRSFALSMTQVQAMGMDETMRDRLKGMAKEMLEMREEFGKKYMIFDKLDRREENCNWDYLDFDEITSNKEINVISFYFMLRKNTITTISSMIGILNELLSRAMEHRKKSDVFSIYIPEIQILLPKGVRQLEIVAKTLRYRLLIGLLLMRSFNARMRINLQNLSSLESDLFSQSKIYMGKTQNPRDLRLLREIYKFPDNWVKKMFHLPIGMFVDVQREGKKKMFNLVPKSHKAIERESFLMKLSQFNKNPSNFLFETSTCYLSDLDFVNSEGTLVEEYNKKVKEWINEQETLMPKSLDISEATETFREMEEDKSIAKELGIAR